ncbi:MAG: valine--tRNA ligase [Candidatus Aenigmatarchaeota archaeon]
MGMAKNYDPEEIEEKWQEKWQEMGLFKFDPDSDKPVFPIDTPPPTASGSLHMGHAKSYTEFEIVARAMRLLGYNVFFPIGYDDNGLPTEKYVEEELGVKKKDVGKEEFVKKCKGAADNLEVGMTELFEKLGMSWDWSTQYKTMNEQSQRAAQLSFLELLEDGEAYRKDDPILWCPYHETSLAQATVEDKERHTKLNYLYFETEDDDKIEVATTRPELLPSCVAVFVHPEDEEHQDLIGKKVKVPLFDFEVPVMEGEEVDQEFGSGIVMVCTFGDNTDMEMWKKYDLPLKISITPKGVMNERAGKYEGLEIEEAKKRIIGDLKKEDIIFDQEDLQQTVGVCWRCETPIEFIPTKQWFVNILDHKDELIEQGEKINWYPEYYEKRYKDWVENLKWDWCVSRQRYHGVPFPAWYCKDCGNIVLANKEDLPVDPRYDEVNYSCPECGSEDLKGEEDVMDTWMTSSLTPQITGKWQEDEELFNKVFPMSLRPQSHDIIRTWAFYTIYKSYMHNNSIPWEDVMISGYVYAKEGVGMSKSKGTGVDPEHIIEEEGADCLRYWAAGATTGEDIIYEQKKVVRGRKILTKLWNASRFVEMHINKYEEGDFEPEEIDRWILTRTKEMADRCEKHYRNYDVSKVRRTAVNFFKGIFCDNYLEMVKHRLYNPDEVGEESQQAAIHTLYEVLLSCLKVLSPIVPHITEEIYQNIFHEWEEKESINRTGWPEIEKGIDEEAKEKGEIAKDLIATVRKWKSDNGIPLNEELAFIQVDASSEIQEKVEAMKDVIRGTINIKEISYQRTRDSGEAIEVQNQPIEIKKIGRA